MENWLFVLGAMDPEMVRIRAILDVVGMALAVATVDGKPVHPGNAARANGYTLESGSGPFDRVYFVECRVAGITPHGIIDHHAPGDRGYGRPPEEFWEASSLGQVYSELGNAGWDVYAEAGFRSGGWDEDDLLAAAADHCLREAYRGRCPGVTPSALYAFRLQTRAEFQKISEMEIVGKMDRTWFEVCGCPERSFGAGSFIDLRGKHLDELVEVSMLYDFQYIASVSDRDGREKVTASGNSDFISWFLREGGSEFGLSELYGDPARGFAGGYLR